MLERVKFGILAFVAALAGSQSVHLYYKPMSVSNFIKFVHNKIIINLNQKYCQDLNEYIKAEEKKRESLKQTLACKI
jgi:hypothetical protein